MGSKELAYFNVFPTDLMLHLVKTGEPAEITGIRLRLWAASCNEDPPGTLPDDPKQLSRWAGVPIARWKKVAAEITGGWTMAGGRWQIRRILAQVEERNRRSRAGQTGAEARHGRNAIAPESHSDRTSSATQVAGESHVSLQKNRTASSSDPIRSSSDPIPEADRKLRGDPARAGASNALPGSDPPDPPPSRKRFGPSRGPQPAKARLGPEQRGIVDQALGAIFERFPADEAAIEILVDAYVNRGGPWPPLERALTHAAQHADENAWGYLDRVLRIEEPNQHARDSEAKAAELDAPRADPNDPVVIDARAEIQRILRGAGLHSEGA